MGYSFEKHRIVGGIGADDPFWQALEDGEFRLQQCSGCGAWSCPAHWRCGRCGSWDFQWVKLDPVGKIFAWTRSWYAFERVAERAVDVPYVTVLAEIPAADGARILGVLEGSDQDLRIGAPVRGIITPPAAKSKNYASIRWKIES